MSTRDDMLDAANIAVLTLPQMVEYTNQVLIPVGGSALFAGMSGMGKTQATIQNIKINQDADADFGGAFCNWSNMEAIDARGLPRVTELVSSYGIPPWMCPVPELGLRGAFPALCPENLRGDPATWTAELAHAYATAAEQLATGKLIPYTRGIVGIDEALQTLEDSMLLVLAQLADEHRIGQWGVPMEGWAVVMLTNRMQDQAGVRELHAHTRNRMSIWEVAHDPEATLDYWYGIGMNDHFRYFASVEPQTVFTAKVPEGQRQFCTPRSWHRAHNEVLMWLHNVDRVPVEELTTCMVPHEHAMLPSLIAARCGSAAAVRFTDYLRNAELRPEYTEIVKAPMKARLPGQSAVIRGVIEMLSDKVNLGDLDKVCTYMKREDMPTTMQSIFCHKLTRRPHMPVDALYQHGGFMSLVDTAGPSVRQMIFAAEYKS